MEIKKIDYLGYYYCVNCRKRMPFSTYGYFWKNSNDIIELDLLYKDYDKNMSESICDLCMYAHMTLKVVTVKKGIEPSIIKIQRWWRATHLSPFNVFGKLYCLLGSIKNNMKMNEKLILRGNILKYDLGYLKRILDYNDDSKTLGEFIKEHNIGFKVIIKGFKDLLTFLSYFKPYEMQNMRLFEQEDLEHSENKSPLERS